MSEDRKKMTPEELRKAKLFFPDLMGLDPNEDDGAVGVGPTAEEKAETDSRIIQVNREYGEDFDIAGAMRAAKDPLTGMLRDLKIDDQDLPLAKNYYDFCFNIVGQEINPPWARQMWVALVLFGEVCPRCSDKPWLVDITNVPVKYESKDLPDHLQLLEHGVCPKCKANKQELYVSGEMRVFQELVLVWGQRSGKSTSCALMSAYHTHRFLKMPKFGTLTRSMQSSTPLTFSFVSLTFGKAFTLLWEPLVKVMQDSVWYQNLFQMLDHYGKKYGVELYNRKTEFIKFFYKNLNLVPTHPGWEALRGETRFGAAMDELGLFPLPELVNAEDDLEGEAQIVNTKKMANADQAHKSLNNSLTTVQNVSLALMAEGKFHVPTGIMFGVSSPTSHRDKVMRLLAQSQTEEGAKTMLGIQLPTWEVNPYMGRDTPLIVRTYASNPEDAERDFGANPPRIYATYIRRENVDKDVFVGGRNSHQIEYDYSDNEITASVRRVFTCRYPSVLTIDAGHTNNSFTLCSQYYDRKSGKTVTTTVLEIIPTGKRKINFGSVYKNVVLPVARDTNAALVFADRWNSLKLLYDIEADIPGVTAKQFTPSRRHFDAARSLLLDGDAILPNPEMPMVDLFEKVVENYRQTFMHKPVAHLVHQMTTVRDLHTKRPPEKGEGYTDDIFRAWVLGSALIHLPKVQAILQDWKEQMDKNGTSPPALFVGRSGIGVYPGLQGKR